jgi:hypothetical protein
MYTNIKPGAKFTPTQKAQGDITTLPYIILVDTNLLIELQQQVSSEAI